jgi:hypothetical protein
MGKTYTRQELIDEALRFERENGRIPIKDDMMVFKGYPSFELYKKEFGSWSNALMEIFGYIPEDRKACNKSYRNNYTKQELINELLRFEELHGRIPSIHELKVKDGWICRTEFIKVFGSWEAALNETPFKTRIDINFFNPENMDLRKWNIVGYIIGDGNVHGNRLSITSSEDDKENLFNIHQYMKLDTKIYSREGDGKRLYTISKSCKRWIEDLELLGVLPNKSFTSKIPTWYIKTKEEAAAICRGIFDADGSITIHSNDHLYPKFSVSGSEELCNDYSFYLEKYCGIKCNPSKLKSIFVLQVNGTQCEKIYDFLYGHENFYIKRKKERFEKLINGTFSLETDKY